MILPADASKEEFYAYVIEQRGAVPDNELEDLWEWRQKLQGIRVVTGRGERSQLPPEEQHMTLKEREQKVISDARAQGKDPVPVGNRWV